MKKELTSAVLDKIQIIFDRNLNLPKIICNHTIGKNHSYTHRMRCGVLVMMIGVAISKSAAHIPHTSTIWIMKIIFFVSHYAVDAVGYFIHGVGALPIVEKLLGHEDNHIDIELPAVRGTRKKNFRRSSLD